MNTEIHPLAAIAIVLAAVLTVNAVMGSGDEVIDKAASLAAADLRLSVPNIHIVERFPSNCKANSFLRGCFDGRKIWIAEGLSDYDKIETTAHEMAHVWQLANGFQFDSAAVPYAQRRQERHARAYSAKFMQEVGL